MKISLDRAQLIFQSTLDDSTSQLTSVAVSLNGEGNATPPFDILSGDRVGTQLGWYELQIYFGALQGFGISMAAAACLLGATV